MLSAEPPKTLPGFVIVTLAIIALTASGLKEAGPPMDEGALLAYPIRLAEGDTPHQDFLTFNGPGTYWVNSGAFALFGEGIAMERGIGLISRLTLVLGVFLIARALGGRGPWLAAISSGVIMLDDGLQSYPWFMALGFGLLGLGLLSTLSTRENISLVHCLLTGVLIGSAVMTRFDLGIAFAVAALPLLVRLPVKVRWAVLGGALPPTMGLFAHLLSVGPANMRRIATEYFRSIPGRKLPLPEIVSPAGRLFLLVTVAGVVLVIVAIWAILKGRQDPRTPVVVSLGIMAALTFPYVLSRADTGHILAVACLTVPLMTVAVLHSVGGDANRWALVGGAVTLIGVLALSPDVVGKRLVTNLSSLAQGQSVPSYTVEVQGRSFFVGSQESAMQLTTILEAADAATRPGDRLFVGPLDLRRSNYNDTFIYYLLADLTPATFYMEMNPGTANRAGSGLAREVSSADILILNSAWDGWNEPNASAQFGPNEPNRVVRREFCLLRTAGTYQLHERCGR